MLNGWFKSILNEFISLSKENSNVDNFIDNEDKRSKEVLNTFVTVLKNNIPIGSNPNLFN